eukprot:TRINITY_DN48_c0_g1_i2.p1 TRINITY_DN48_c0_g1~~TRINITY_DN48_c0_g1_i2.p1  ORF type:complete len:529 (+),score=233.85 TRINITY_DN48_c0_g1_i2:94-1680(+)
MAARWAAAPPLLGLLLAAALPQQASARISGGRFKIQRDIPRSEDDDSGQVVYLGAFGYGEGGRCAVRVTENAKDMRFPEDECFPSDPGQPTNTTHHTGFFMVDVDNVNRARTIPLNTEEYELCTNAGMPCSDVVPMHECNKAAHTDTDGDPPCGKGEWRGVREVPAPGFYALFFFNCRLREVDLVVRVSEYNMDGDEKDYLQVGDRPLPVLFLVLFFVYIALIVLWGWNMKNHKAEVHNIHYLMALLLVLKSGTLLFESLKYFAFQRLGTGVAVWDVFFYIFMMLKGVLLFTGILLIGTGWSFVKPCLQQRDKRILLFVLPLQVIVNIALIVIDETTEGDPSWSSWQEALRVADIICCCLVLLPIVWSVSLLKNAQSADGKVARNLSRLRQFRTFYICVVAYIYFTRIIVVLIESALHYQWTFLGPLTAELGSLCFYVFTGLKFRPMKKNPYLELEAADFEEGGRELCQELEDRAKDRADLAAGNRSTTLQGGTAGTITAKAEARHGGDSPRGGGPVKAVSRRDEVDI